MTTIETAIIVGVLAVISLWLDSYISQNVVPVSTALALGSLLVGVLGLLSAYSVLKAGVWVVILVGWFFTAGKLSGEEGDALVLQHKSQDDPDAVRSETDKLIEWLESENENTREAAAGTLANLAEEYPQDVEPAIQRLLNLLDDPNMETRTHAATALGHLAEAFPEQTRPATPKLIEMLDSDDSQERVVALMALTFHAEEAVDHGWEDTVTTIASGLTDSLDHVSETEYPLILTGLEDIAEKYPSAVEQAEEPLSRLLSHPDSEIRKDACSVIGLIGRNSPLQESTKARLRELREDPDPEIQSIATEATDQIA